MTTRRLLAVALALGLCSSTFAADKPAPAPKPVAAQPKPKAPEKPKPPAYITVEQAGPDYKIQGEYGEAEAGKAPLGVQVIALGADKFKAVVYPGGLPGAGWSGDKKTKVELTGSRTPDAVALQGKGYSATIPADGSSITVKAEGGATTSLKKIERKSPTLGQAAPAGAIVLFDGKSLDAWEGGTIDDRGLLAVQPKEPRTKQKFTDFTLHCEFVTPFMPTAGGQGRGNSGVYLQNRYEVQVLDSFALEGLDNECGGLYKNAAPKVNMCLPPLVWQTYDIDFSAPRFEDGKKVKNAALTVKHNGVTIHENLEIKDKTGGGEKEATAPGIIKFQNHGNPVFYRNVWVVEKK